MVEWEIRRDRRGGGFARTPGPCRCGSEHPPLPRPAANGVPGRSLRLCRSYLRDRWRPASAPRKPALPPRRRTSGSPRLHRLEYPRPPARRRTGPSNVAGRMRRAPRGRWPCMRFRSATVTVSLTTTFMFMCWNWRWTSGNGDLPRLRHLQPCWLEMIFSRRVEMRVCETSRFPAFPPATRAGRRGASALLGMPVQTKWSRSGLGLA
jgi:hypothetical protein